ncbi:putative damage-inducible protein DinB [Lewinella marina]|uniref:DinB family protein n=1 Tax=Neolewinella marina TaxID=438751 RepID=A0A2G0CHE9_9BACT|nr:DinB family protein [Neolewinella marina]NJB86173.1 putative damage-inducible protein DinB [Neolewinella marina]PHK99350.1 hypothetical protein CGL56_07820 [Neolewinella marina]
MRYLTLLLLVVAPLLRSAAQTDSLLPYADISAYPTDYAAGTVLSRMVDALGFRYYWATEGLREEDLTFRPTEGARNAHETLEHIDGLTRMILAAARRDTLGKGEAEPAPTTYPALRERTLRGLAEASALFSGQSSTELGEQRLRFSSGGQYSEFPVWNLINGPLADAIYHTGQLVTLRRMTGNPGNPQVNHFRGSAGR